MENLRNIVILKDLPSNLIEEAFVVLKKNQRARNLERINNKNKDFTCEKNGEDDKNFIVREAELLLADYLEEPIKEGEAFNIQNNDINKKYRRLKKVASLLACALFFAIIYILL